MQIKVLQEQKRTGRQHRRPQHTFSLRARPWQIQPMMIAPVLPGETMKNLLLQSRVVSQPIKSRLVGWHAEYFFFYVKQRDLPGGDDIVMMHLDATKSMAAYQAGAFSQSLYTGNGGIKWVELCLQRVTEEFFREEADGTWNAKAIDSIPIAAIGRENGFESLRDATAVAATQNEELPGEVSELPFGVNSGQWATYYAQWESMRALKQTVASFEDWLASWGVKTPEVNEVESRPELIRYIRDWTYPTNTVNPTDGTPTTALSWSIAERADKDRFFQEPGFIFGVQVIRPKIYLSAQKGNLSAWLNDAYGWLPPALAEQGWTSLKTFAAAAGPLNGNSANGYWLDMRDLFVFGDQFINYDIVAAGDGSALALPDNGHQLRFATAAMADSLFVTPSTKNYIQSDGVVSLDVLGKIVNLT